MWSSSIRLSQQFSAKPPPRLHNVTPANLRSHLQSALPGPLILTGLIDNWKALQNWTPQNDLGRLRHNAAEDKFVDIELSGKRKSYMDKDYKKITMPLGLFLDAFILDKVPGGNDTNMTAYLAQQDLFGMVPELTEDAPILPHAQESGLKNQFWRRNIWIGRHTFTPIHKDPYNNLFCQVVGRKRILIFHPRQHSHLYISSTPPQTNTSTILSPPSFPSILEQYPQLKLAMEDDYTRMCEIEPGETLFLPEGWFHCVESVGDEASISVNHWFR